MPSGRASDKSGDIDQTPEIVIPVDQPAKRPQTGPSPGTKVGSPILRLFRNIPIESMSCIVFSRFDKIASDSSRLSSVVAPIWNDIVNNPTNTKNKIIRSEIKKFKFELFLFLPDI